MVFSCHLLSVSNYEICWDLRSSLQSSAERGVTAHCVAPAQYVAGDKMCPSGTYGFGRQNVPCESTHFVVPHWMDLNIHSDIYVVNTKEAIHYILVVCI